MAEELQPEEPIIASTSYETESVSTIPCAICRRQFSRYTCPRCNIPYCSLVCFRSEKHGDCSETFYRKEVEVDVKNAPSASAEEKRRMMELLKRFEEDTLEDNPLLDSSDNEDDDEAGDLQRRLQNIDLDSASYDELWDALTPSERENFMRAVGDPNSELAQQLLASEELEQVQIEPWWETPADTMGESTKTPNMAVSELTGRRQGSKPPIMNIPESLVRQSSNAAMNGPLLLYNICATCIAYVYAIRHFAVSSLSSLPSSDPEFAEVRRLLSRLVPFLAERRSTLVHMSLSAVVTDLWSRFPAGHMDPGFFSLLLRDTATLLHPTTVTVLVSVDESKDDLEAHPSASVLRVLSDLASFFGPPMSAKPNHVAHKLTFYAAYVLSTPTPMLRVLVDEATIHSKTLESEAKRGGGSNITGAAVKRVRKGEAVTPKIEIL